MVVQQFLFRQFSGTDILAGKHANSRFNDAKSIMTQSIEIILGDRIFKHVGVHCRSDQFFAAAGKYGSREHVISDAVCHLGNDVCRSRSDHYKVCTFCKSNVFNIILKIAVKGINHAAGVAKCFKGERSDKLGSIFGHDDLYIAVLFCKHAGNICHFVGGN